MTFFNTSKALKEFNLIGFTVLKNVGIPRLDRGIHNLFTSLDPAVKLRDDNICALTTSEPDDKQFTYNPTKTVHQVTHVVANILAQQIPL